MRMNAAHGRGGNATPTIHNYFPDGAVFSAALIDTLGEQDFDTHLWLGQGGDETLAFSSGTGPSGANEVKMTLPVGSIQSSGLYVLDWSNHYGCGQLAVGTYYIGVTVRASSSISLHFESNCGPGDNSDQIHTENATVTGTPQRIVVSGINTEISGVGFSVSCNNAGEDGKIVYFSNLMVTEDVDAAFADGSTTGWSWSGTAHASISSGPKP